MSMPDPLFEHVMNRRSHKAMFLKQSVERATAQQLSEFATIYTSGEDRTGLQEIAQTRLIND